MTELWPVVPLQTLVVESLSRENNAMFDDELHRVIESTYGELSMREINTVLMYLELRGLIQVHTVIKQKRRVRALALLIERRARCSHMQRT